MESVLRTYGLTKSYGQRKVVNNVNMTIERGEIYGLIGRNGAGKTTFMRLVIRLALPDSGEIELFGGEDALTAGQKIGSIIETPALYGGCSAFENLKRFSLLCKNGITDDRYLYEMIDTVGLSEAGNKKVGHYSMGMKQRLGLAVAMLGNPEFMVLDEPVNGLDPAGIKYMRDAIIRLNAEQGITFLISSHLLDELARTVTKYGIINDGVLVEEITAHELVQRNRRYIAITVNEPEHALVLLAGKIPARDIVPQGNIIYVYNHTENAADINTMLVTGGVSVSSLEMRSFSVENYFIERMGRQI